MAENNSFDLNKTPFYKKNWFVWVMLVLFFPIGLILLWMGTTYSNNTKGIITVLFISITIGAGIMDDKAVKDTPNATQKPVVQVSGSKATEQKTAEPKIKLTPYQSRIKKDLQVPDAQAIEIESVFKQCGIETYESLKRDENIYDLDEKKNFGYRLTTKETKNVFLFLDEQSKVYALRLVDINLYKDGKLQNKLSSFILTNDEMFSLAQTSEELINKILVAPATAKYASADKWYFNKTPKGTTVQSYVDSQNRMGANLRSQFKITYLPDSQRATSIIFNGEEILK